MLSSYNIIYLVLTKINTRVYISIYKGIVYTSRSARPARRSSGRNLCCIDYYRID